MLAALGSEIFLSLAPIYIEASCPSELPPYEPNVSSSSNRFQIHLPSPDRRRDLFWQRFSWSSIHYSKGSSAAAGKILNCLFLVNFGSSWSSWQGKKVLGPNIRKGRKGGPRKYIHRSHHTNKCRPVCMKKKKWPIAIYIH